MVAPRIAALEAAMMVKSLPVRPRRTSLCWVSCGGLAGEEGVLHLGVLFLEMGWCMVLKDFTPRIRSMRESLMPYAASFSELAELD